MSKIDDLAKDGTALLDERQRQRLKQLGAIERLLLRKMLYDLRGVIEEKDGRIVTRRGYASLSKLVDQAFDAIEERGLQAIGARMAKDIGAVLDVNAAYYRVVAANQGERFREITRQVIGTLNRRLGIDGDGQIQRRGYLEQLFRTDAARDEIKKLISKSVTAGVPMRKLEKAMRVAVRGTDESAGVLEKHIGGFVLDTYNMADAVANEEFGKRLGMRYFIYTGGIIETSRKFCRDRNGRVFSTEEANEQWPLSPDLPRTKAEKESKTLTDYVPLQDRGRWLCRHRLLFIDEAEAKRRRADLR